MLSMKYLINVLKNTIDEILLRSIGLEFRSDNIINSKAIKYILKKYFPIMTKVVWFYFI